MDNKEAIYRIQDHMRVHRLYEPNAFLINEALNLAIKALHEREPKPPIRNKTIAEFGTIWKCGRCERAIDKGDAYCVWCGQAVKWK